MDEAINGTGIVRHNLLGNMETEIEEVRLASLEVILAINKFKAIAGSHNKENKLLNILISSNHMSENYNNVIGTLHSSCWYRAFNEMGRFKQLLTADELNKFTAEQSKHTSFVFSRTNVLDYMTALHARSGDIMKNCILAVFDRLTTYYKENQQAVEGWKTNDAFIIKRKVIIPYVVRYGEYMNAHDIKQYGDKFSLNYEQRHKLNDIERVMMHLTQNKDPHYRVSDALERHFDNLGRVRTGDSFETLVDSTFFKLRFYKKGTLHLWFKDEKAWMEMNRIACIDKNWLKPGDKTDLFNQGEDTFFTKALALEAKTKL